MLNTSLKVLILLFIFHPISAIYATDDPACNCIITDENEESYLENIKIQSFDVYIFLLGAPVAFFCTIFITYTFIRYPKARKLPGDLVFFVSLSDCILCIHWFTSALYQVISGPPISEGKFCQFNSFLSLMAGTGEFAYNCLFCFYIRLSLQNVLKYNKKLAITLHLLAWSVMIGFPLCAQLMDLSGKSLFGTCSLKQRNGFSFGGVFLVLLYTILSSYTIAYFKTTVPDEQRYLIEKENFLGYYIRYIIASCLIWSTQACCYVIVGLNCQYWHKNYLLVFITICNLAKLCTPIVLSILRYNDPTIKEKVRKIFKKVTRINQTESIDSNLGIENYNFMDKIQHNMKKDTILTLLEGIRKSCQQDQVFEKKFLESRIRINSDNFTIKRHNSLVLNDLQSSFGISEDDINEEKVYIIDESDSHGQISDSVQIIESEFIVYAPRIFKLIREKDQDIDIYRSLDPSKNKEQIHFFQGPDGGRGGEFFFFSSDNKIVIKTINLQELKVLRNRLSSYALHILTGDSLISPIYGIYSRSRGGAQENLLVMRNILQVPTKFKKMTFDLKGSENDREVLAKPTKKELKDITLKDIDFQKLEGRVFIKEEMAKQVREILIKDAQFFERSKLMDYSLLIIKVDWDSYCSETSEKKGHDSIRVITSVKEKGIRYHLGIIDYLQEYNSQKILEEQAKRAMQKQNTSAKPPDQYAKRFIDKIAVTIF